MHQYLDLIRHATEDHHVDRVVSDILGAIGRICDLVDRGEPIASVAKRYSLTEAKVRKLYRIRNNRMRLALQNFYQEVLAPVQVQPTERHNRNVRKVSAGSASSANKPRRMKSKAYVRKLIEELHGTGVQS